MDRKLMHVELHRGRRLELVEEAQDDRPPVYVATCGDQVATADEPVAALRHLRAQLKAIREP